MIGCKEALTDAPGEDLEKGNGVVDPRRSVGICIHTQKARHCFHAAVSFWLIEGDNPLGYCLLFSIKISCYLQLDGRGSRCNGVGCRKVERNCWRNIVSVICIIWEAELAVLLLSLAM